MSSSSNVNNVSTSNSNATTTSSTATAPAPAKTSSKRKNIKSEFSVLIKSLNQGIQQVHAKFVTDAKELLFAKETQQKTSGYLEFFSEYISQVKGTNKEISQSDKVRIVADQWNALSEEDKEVYKKRASIKKAEFAANREAAAAAAALAEENMDSAVDEPRAEVKHKRVASVKAPKARKPKASQADGSNTVDGESVKKGSAKKK